MEESDFGFKKLKVWQRALDFADQVIELSENLETSRKHYRLLEQIEAASASIPQNIAEGKGRHTDKEFKQFLYYSRGSLFEVVTLLNLFHLRNWISDAQLKELEIKAEEVGKMLNGLIKSI
jgi:four helix bundle protein